MKSVRVPGVKKPAMRGFGRRGVKIKPKSMPHLPSMKPPSMEALLKKLM